MTPLIIVPARQMSEGRPCKNREAWPALHECLQRLPDWPLVVVTDDPMLPPLRPTQWTVYYYADAHHPVSAKVQLVLGEDGRIRAQIRMRPHDPVIVLQPSSPTRNRSSYVLAAVEHLEQHPEHSSVTGVVRWDGTPPTKACHLTPEGLLVVPAVEARQAHPPAYRRDGTVYCARMRYAATGDLYGPHPIPLLIDPTESATLD